jgi:hypothetical protein
MTSNHFVGYRDGYLQKTAKTPILPAAVGAGSAAAGAITEGAATLLPYVLLIPAIMGAGAGAAHSKLTSPSQTDIDTVQKALETAEMEEFATELNRQREAAVKAEGRLADQKETGSARTLRI